MDKSGATNYRLRLRQVLRELPAAKTVEAIEALLPWNVKAALLTKPTTETIVELEAQV